MDAETATLLQDIRNSMFVAWSDEDKCYKGGWDKEIIERLAAALARHHEQRQPYMHEDALPHMTQEAYDAWYAKSWIRDGVRVGLFMGAEWAAENTDEIIQPDFDSLAREPEQASGSAPINRDILAADEAMEPFPCEVWPTVQNSIVSRGGSYGFATAAVTQPSADEGTPETNALLSVGYIKADKSGWDFHKYYNVMTAHAKALERDRNRLQRENAELRKAVNLWKSGHDIQANFHRTAERELSSLQSTLTIHCETHGVVQAAACKYCVSELSAAQECIAGMKVIIKAVDTVFVDNKMARHYFSEVFGKEWDAALAGKKDA